MDIAKGAVEEILRFDGPIKSMWRLTSEDTELAGEHVEKGSRVLLVQSAANRDPGDSMPRANSTFNAHPTITLASATRRITAWALR